MSKQNAAKQVIYSPLKRWRHAHCSQCGDQCNPSEQRFMACILCDFIDATRKAGEMAKIRGASY